ncbi:mannonate dehydratase [Algisphaera agarilytica]|uniref:Mannonate dehydratase n=1 Tax=Algisphaera agarilytica TaxID=1385975 RepID=A0A7X0LM06_9BACT|nr:mannonate dehydratase [Algisphaera agarilytica]MBB6430518.1 mannonate dehydratase [Algisphaera agarilytica]
MKMTMRWFGTDDPVPLSKIRQIPGVTGIVSAIYDVEVGDVWPFEKIAALRQIINQEGLELDVIESISVHEDIKLGLPTRDDYIDAYCESIRNVGKAGIPTLCYNFMPVFDWTRTNLQHTLADGSHALSFCYEELNDIDLDAEGAANLPGWSTVYTPERFKELIEQFRALGTDTLWNNLTYFLERVVPVAEEAGVKMAIHPDDPPWSILGLPRIVTGEAAYERITRVVDSPSNGITVCTGSLGASLSNDLPQIVSKFGKRNRINFVHMRNVAVTGNKQFHEAPHLSRLGTVDMYAVMKALVATGYDGPLRPDHGRMIWGEEGRPGYGLFDRSLGLMYLQGLMEAAKSQRNSQW